jgi:hypothetical protein
MRSESVINDPGLSYSLPTGRVAKTLNLKLAGRHFAIRGIPAGWQDLLPPRLLDCRTKGAGAAKRTIMMEMTSSEQLRPVSEPHNLNDTSRLGFSLDAITLKSDWCESRFNINPEVPARLRVHTEASPWFGHVLENLLRVLVAYDVLQRGGVLLHCAAIVKNDRAVVLFGHSGSGKSTTSALALENGCSVISDDINVIEPGRDGWQVKPVPFSGTLNTASDISRPVALDGLFRLHQASKDRVQPCSLARAVSLLMGSAPFVNQDSYRYSQLVDVLSKLSAAPGVQDLYFTNSHEFLKHVFVNRAKS